MSNVGDLLYAGTKEIGIAINARQIEQFEMYCAMLIEWNEKFNLTAIVEPQEIAVKHFIDSLTLLKFCDISLGAQVIDVGTGAGFPGIPLKIVRPDLSLVLLDSLRKRTQFLQAVIEQLSLASVTVIHGRAEEIAHDAKYRAVFDFAVSRAVAPLAILAEYCLPFIRLGGCFIAMKGPDISGELADAETAIKMLGGKIYGVRTFSLPVSGDARSLVSIEHISPVPAKYPRKPGMPEKKPLGGIKAR